MKTLSLRGGIRRIPTSSRGAFFALRAGFAGCATHAACGRCLLPFGQFTFWQSQESFLPYHVSWFHKSVPRDCHVTPLGFLAMTALFGSSCNETWVRPHYRIKI